MIIYAGSLVNPAILAQARPEAEKYNSAGMHLAEQIEVMQAAVAKGRLVARLHTGDPSIYGAILEQMRELDKLGIAYRLVPGVTSAFAAAAALGLEFTVPDGDNHACNDQHERSGNPDLPADADPDARRYRKRNPCAIWPPTAPAWPSS